ASYTDAKKPEQVEQVITIPAPANAAIFNPQQDLYYKFHDKNNVLEEVYEYRNINQQLIGYVVRIKNTETQEKEIIPVSYVQDKGWRAKGFGDNRPLYNE